MSVVEGQADEAIVWGRRALAADPAVTSTDEDRHGPTTVARGIAGRTAEALAGVAWLDGETSIGPTSFDAATARGVIRLHSDDLAGARSDLTAVAESSHSHVPHQRIVLAHGHLADVEFRSGRWDRATVHAEHALSIAVDTDQVWLLAFLHANASYPWSRRGAWDLAEMHADRSREFANHSRIPASVNYASTAVAMLALSRDQPELVIEATEEVSSWHTMDGIFEPGMLCWPELRAEALVRVRRFDEGEALVDRLLEKAHLLGRHSTLAAAYRIRGLLEAARGHVAPGVEAFAQALDHAHRVAMPFEPDWCACSSGRTCGGTVIANLPWTTFARPRRSSLHLGRCRYLSVAQNELQPADSRHGAAERPTGEADTAGVGRRPLGRRRTVEWRAGAISSSASRRSSSTSATSTPSSVSIAGPAHQLPDRRLHVARFDSSF